jgi:hypothetical protein
MKPAIAALLGAVLGYFLVTEVCGLTTGSNLSGVLGLLFGVPCGALAAVQITNLVWGRRK